MEHRTFNREEVEMLLRWQRVYTAQMIESKHKFYFRGRQEKAAVIDTVKDSAFPMKFLPEILNEVKDAEPDKGGVVVAHLCKNITQ